MNLDNDDKEYLQAILSGHYAKLEKEIYIMSTKLDMHIENEDVKVLKEDVEVLKTESANHAYKRKWQYAAIVIIGIVITIFTNISKWGIL